MQPAGARKHEAAVIRLSHFVATLLPHIAGCTGARKLPSSGLPPVLNIQLPRNFIVTLLKTLSVGVMLLTLSACSVRQLLVQGLADELATQTQAPEEDVVLAHEASAFYLKLSESLLKEAPGNAKLAEAVSAGFTQYSFAFVSFEAERLEAKDIAAAHKLRQRAAKLYGRAQRHAMKALEHQTPGFAKALASTNASDWPKLDPTQIGLAYWAAASWGGFISLSKDDPATVADLPLATRLAQLAWDKAPNFGDGALASLMGSFESARPGGSRQQALLYFNQAIAASAGNNAGAFVAKAEGIALPDGNRAEFESLLKQALAVSANSTDLPSAVMRERAQWRLETADDLF